MFAVAPHRRSPLARRAWPLLAGAVVVIAVMVWVSIGSAIRADRAREIQVTMQHLRGEGLHVEGVAWGALATSSDERSSVSVGYAIYRRMLTDIRTLQRLGLPPARMKPIERALAAVTEAGFEASSARRPGNAEARAIVETRFGPAIRRFVVTVGRAADLQGREAQTAKDLSFFGSAGALTGGLLLLGLLGWAGHRIRRAAALEALGREDERRAEQRIRALVRHSSDVVAIVDELGVFGWISEPVRELLGREPGALVGTAIAALVHPDDIERLGALLTTGTTEKGGPETETLRLAAADGSFRDVEVIADDVRDDPNLAGVLLNLRDVSERQALQRQLRHQAFHDSLTGLPNRALFDDRLGRALSRARRHDLHAALIYVDLDDFKSINDGFGHSGGDELLRSTAERLARTVRPEDTAARMGGDEFAVLVEDVADPARVLAMAERIGVALAEPLVIGGQRVTPTASVGVATLARDATAESARVNADLALYEAKRRGRARVVVFTPQMRDHLDDRLQLTADLERAARDEALSLAFQPIVDLESGAVVALEALLRWEHAERGPIGPDRFVPLAEDTGLIVPIGLWVLERALAQLAAWDAAVPAARELTLNVNVSTTQLRRQGFAAAVGAVLVEAGIAPARLTLEITESVLLDDSDGVHAELRALRDLGVALALDDFGTGYSSLAYLQRFPVDVLKIDRSFVTGIVEDAERARLVHGIVKIGRTLDLQVVIEGIEDRDAAQLVRDMGACHGQGFLFSRPVPAADVPLLLSRPSLLDRENA